ncbi:MAG: peptidyl-prolyl cis-trans isomerase [Oceanospirillales bacterium]|nr:peptidyl-prolyl cis-trans isomerase [Oceanospirillales bacterium]
MFKPLLTGLMLAATISSHALAESVLLETSQGEILLELDSDKAPASVTNFLTYAEQGHYNGLVFHRVIPGFMVQGGGFTPDMEQLDTSAPVKNESDNGLSNLRGTIAMARTRDPDSATAQFFINTVDNRRLDGMPGRPGYTVFGKVTRGMDVVDAISKTATGNRGRYQNVPVTPVVIQSVQILKTEAPEAETEQSPAE